MFSHGELGIRSHLRVLFIRTLQILAFSCFLILPARAETQPPVVHTRIRCGRSAELRLSSPASSQGGLLLAELRSGKPLKEPKGKWDGKEISFWDLKAIKE